MRRLKISEKTSAFHECRFGPDSSECRYQGEASIQNRSSLPSEYSTADDSDDDLLEERRGFFLSLYLWTKGILLVLILAIAIGIGMVRRAFDAERSVTEPPIIYRRPSLISPSTAIDQMQPMTPINSVSQRDK
eukprot:TRINITY_DN7623_c0_g1_i1.p1 TRINITY_DN7623_c0_g1~~TRINITY_DN7623_c0_g1_i1.p1  ORF type:complete len:133 (+),score=32.50 TRINITY_DN7623_c0_g1_i1:63-461(+)